MYASFLTFAIPHNEVCKVRVRILLALGCPKSSSSQPKLSPSPFSSGIAPALVVPPLLQRFGLTVDDIALWELNEGESTSNLSDFSCRASARSSLFHFSVLPFLRSAFASQSIACINELKIQKERVNPKGGAIALGHPLGASGGRLVTSLLAELRRTGAEQPGIATMCCGTGYGVAVMISAE